MKARDVVLGVMAGFLGFAPLSAAMSFPPERAAVTLEGRLTCPYMSVHGGTAYLQIRLAVGGMPRPDRRPMNIAVVVDRSGSMADAKKIDYARQAVLRVIEQLSREDIFSLVIYDDIIEVLRPAQRVGSRSELRRLVEAIYPRGSTNLGGGMIEGFRQAERYACSEYVNRVILLSDGLANQGITDPSRLNRIAGQYRSRTISLSTMGVGLEYNENLMMGLAEAGGGNYFYIESPHSLASILSREFTSACSVVAQNASIELTLGRNVGFVDVVGYDHHPGPGTAVIPVGDLYANECREFTVELRIPEGAGTAVVARGRLLHDAGDRLGGPVPRFTVAVHYTRDVAEVDKHRDLEAQAAADVAVSTRSVEKAMQALDEGRHEEAARAIAEAKQQLAASPAMSAAGVTSDAVRAQQSKLEDYSTMLNEKGADSRGVKKAIQYDNYRTQKRK